MTGSDHFRDLNMGEPFQGLKFGWPNFVVSYSGLHYVLTGVPLGGGGIWLWVGPYRTERGTNNGGYRTKPIPKWRLKELNLGVRELNFTPHFALWTDYLAIFKALELNWATFLSFFWEFLAQKLKMLKWGSWWTENAEKEGLGDLPRGLKKGVLTAAHTYRVYTHE